MQAAFVSNDTFFQRDHRGCSSKAVHSFWLLLLLVVVVPRTADLLKFGRSFRHQKNGQVLRGAHPSPNCATVRIEATDHELATTADRFRRPQQLVSAPLFMFTCSTMLQKNVFFLGPEALETNQLQVDSDGERSSQQNTSKRAHHGGQQLRLTTATFSA